MFEEATKAEFYGEIEAGRSTKVKKQLEALIQSLSKSTFDVAELLYEVKRNHYYTVYGYNTFKEYIDDLDIKQRKAQYLVRIVEVMSAVNVNRPVYEPIGISKLREISSLEPDTDYLDPATNKSKPMNEIILDLVERAPYMSLQEIKEFVKLLKGLTGENELVWLNICVKKTVRDDVIIPALNLAKAHIGSTHTDDDGEAQDASDGRALELLCAEFLSDPNNQVVL